MSEMFLAMLLVFLATVGVFLAMFGMFLVMFGVFFDGFQPRSTEDDSGRSRSGQCLGHFSTPRSLQKLRIAPKCRFVHSLSSGMDRRA